MTDAVQARRFAVHIRDDDRHHAKMVLERTFEAAAVAYLEDVPFSAQPEVAVVVRDTESGHEHCFRVDVETGETTACG